MLWVSDVTDGVQGAKYVAALLESLGAEIKMAQGPQDDTNPVVLGRIGRDTSRPTILFYGKLAYPLCCPHQLKQLVTL